LQAGDALPTEFTSLGGDSEVSRPESARFAGSTATRRIYVVEGRADQMCLIATKGAGETFIGATACMPAADFATRPLVLSAMNDDQTADVVALVADGPASVSQGTRSQVANNNVAILSEVHASKGGVQVQQAKTTTTLPGSTFVPQSTPKP
jgi:hypothetical protein